MKSGTLFWQKSSYLDKELCDGIPHVTGYPRGRDRTCDGIPHVTGYPRGRDRT